MGQSASVTEPRLKRKRADSESKSTQNDTHSHALFELLVNQETERTPTQYKVICLTGGPCGGKTSCLAILTDLFQSLGWKVYRVPEAATTLLSGGVVFSELSPSQSYSFQKNLLQVMLQLEDTFLAKLSAKQGRKAIVICDRGAMDPSAYMPRKEWLKMLKELSLSEAALRDDRYDCVVHLVTAAKHAEKYYSLLNNTTRSEDTQLAQELDEKIMNAWNGHASLQVVDNVAVKNFAEKCDRVVQAVMTRLGLMSHENRYGRPVSKHKFIVRQFDWNAEFPVPYRDFHVEHTYLMNPLGDGMQTRIRRRQEMGHPVVHLNMTIRHPPIQGERIETRRNLLPREYEALKSQVDPKRPTIHKKRRCFLYKDRYYQLDVYEQPHAGLVLLEAYLDYDGNKQVSSSQWISLIPDWLQVENVTNDPQYSMYNLALIEE